MEVYQNSLLTTDSKPIVNSTENQFNNESERE